MDYFSLIKRCNALVISFALLVGCNDQQSVFSSLALINSGKNFPYTQEKLALCQETKDESCLKAYQQVKTAKKSLFSNSREQALQLTLDTISKRCVKQQKNVEEELTCTGAITALYFFPTKHDDDSIRGLLSGTSEGVLRNVVSNGNMWLLNREDKSAWREWLGNSKLSAEDQKAFSIYLEMNLEEKQTINHLDGSA
jgi:hypothetical protein